MTQLPQITKEIITVRRKCKRRDYRLVGIFAGIPFAVLLRLSHPTIIISIDLTIPHLCSCVSVQIYMNMFLFHWITVYKGLKLSSASVSLPADVNLKCCCILIKMFTSIVLSKLDSKVKRSYLEFGY